MTVLGFLILLLILSLLKMFLFSETPDWKAKDSQKKTLKRVNIHRGNEDLSSSHADWLQSQ